MRVTQAEIAAAVGISQQAVAKWKLQDLELGAVAENLAERYPADKARDALMALLVQVGERCDRMEGERSSGRAALIEQVAYGKEIPELPDDEADKIIKSAADLGLARKRATEELIASGAHVPKEDVFEQYGAIYNTVRATLGDELINELRNHGLTLRDARALVHRAGDRIIGEINRQMAPMEA